MSHFRRYLPILLLLIALGACKSKPNPTPEPTPESTLAPTEETVELPEEGQVLISELLPGVPGDNNREFIELYNSGTRTQDLNGWSLWYHSGSDEKLLHQWEKQSDIPGLGHILLLREVNDWQMVADAHYSLSLFEKRGAIELRNSDGETQDLLVWGGEVGKFTDFAPVPTDGASLERLPGGVEGNSTHTGSQEDFALNPAPNPQNSGSDPAPLLDQRLLLSLIAPDSSSAGEEFEIKATLGNNTGKELSQVTINVPMLEGFEIISLPPNATASDEWITWQLDSVQTGPVDAGAIKLKGPWTYVTRILRGAYAESPDWHMRGYAPLAQVQVAGGAIPIATARQLDGHVVTIEGTATMFTDGYYAGSDGTKFYLQDETGGIQAYCPGAMGIVNVAIGDLVRVTGEIEIYRNSLEIIPSTYPDDVQVLGKAEELVSPARILLAQAGSDPSVLGKLNQVQGTATRIQEFSYSYEIDLTDDDGYTQLVYVEKDTGVTAEPLELGKEYLVAGISEMYDVKWQLKPRIQDDFQRVFPPELMVEMSVQYSVLPGDLLEYSITAYNHTDNSLHNVRISATQPEAQAFIEEVMDHGVREGSAVDWVLDELAPNGGSQTVHFTARVSDQAEGTIASAPATASADEWPEAVQSSSEPVQTFVGTGVPIWAIQGAGEESPYVRKSLTTEGIVTGVFPEMEGFWIQEIESDDDPASSAGLYVLTVPEVITSLMPGDLVHITGKVREKSGQTTLHVTLPEDLQVLDSRLNIPTPVSLDPPGQPDESLKYYESLEGMLVQIDQEAVTIAPTTKYGETTLVLSYWGIDRVMKDENLAMAIVVDDGSAVTHYDNSTQPFTLNQGDQLMAVVGPLAYTYERYKIEPVTEPSIRVQDRPLPHLDPVADNQFSVATFNAENLFDFQDPHPSDPPKPNPRQYKHSITKLANTIIAMGLPTVVGLQEVERIEILHELARHELLAEYQYQPFLIEGADSRGIDNAFLVRGDIAEAQAAAYPAADGLTSRPPLLITVTLTTVGAPPIYLLNNHFTSMSAGEEVTEPRRDAQAAWNVELVQRILETDPDAQVIVLGDLNSFYLAKPIDTLRQGGLHHVYEFVEPERPYTYIYQGESETLDHILVTPNLFQNLILVEALHLNADYALPDPDDSSPLRLSDHDPLIAVFTLP